MQDYVPSECTMITWMELEQFFYFDTKWIFTDWVYEINIVKLQ